MGKKDFGSLDGPSLESARKATTRAAFLMAAASGAMLVAYIFSSYFAEDFWTLLAFGLAAATAGLLAMKGRTGAAVLFLGPATLLYLAFDTWRNANDSLGLALYLLTDFLGLVAVGIAAGFTVGPFALAAVFVLGGALFTFLASLGGWRLLEAMIYTDTALLVTGGLILFLRNLLASHARRASEAEAEARREAEEVRRLAAEKDAALAENQELLRELQHRVRNNLQLLSSLMTLQVAAATGPGEALALDPARRRIHALALAHDARFAVKEGSSIDLRSLCRAVAQECGDEAGPEIRMAGDSEPLLVNPARATACALIVEELVCRATARERGQAPLVIDIELHDRGSEGFILSVRDNGQGAIPDAGAALPKDLSLRLVESLSTQIRAELSVADDRRGYSLLVPEVSGL